MSVSTPPSQSQHPHRRIALVCNQLAPGHQRRSSPAALHHKHTAAAAVAKPDDDEDEDEDNSEEHEPSLLDPERAKASFSSRELTYFLDGGKASTRLKELVAASLRDDPVFVDFNRHDLTRSDSRERTMAKIHQCIDVVRSRMSDSSDSSIAVDGQGDVHSQEVGTRSGSPKAFEDAFYRCLGSLDAAWSIRLGVHFGLFAGALNGQGTDEQRKLYETDLQRMNITTCYAMTELGSGSYLQGLETTATFDVDTDEFVIHSPTLTSTKIWIGGAAETATHAVVYARLIVKRVDHGIFGFIVQLRDRSTFALRAGVMIGDMGAKYGRAGLDNGFIQFTEHRIPRANMLQRWARVDRDGTFHPPHSKQMSYSALLATRVELFSSSSETLKKAVTIAVRYGLVRKQFPDVMNPHAPLNQSTQQLMNYQTHQYRLLPLIAQALALQFTAVQMTLDTARLTAQFDAHQAEALEQLPEMHSTSAGLKAFGTWMVLEGIEQCRQCCGGLGYSAHSGLPSLLSDYAVMPQWEGDNTILALQTARYIVKQWNHLRQTKQEPKGFMRYMTRSLSVSSPSKRVIEVNVDSIESCMSVDTCIELHRRATVHAVDSIARRVYEPIDSGKLSLAQSMHLNSVDLLIVSRLHCRLYMLHCMAVHASTAPKALQPVLTRLVLLFGLHSIESDCASGVSMYMLCSGVISVDSMQVYVFGCIRRLMLELRPDVCALIDAFNLPDFILDSPLGRRDGQVYSHFMQSIKNAPNQSAKDGVPFYFDKHIRPLVDPKYKNKES